MRFILVQTILTRQEVKDKAIHNYWDTIIRHAEAESKEHAIGMFTLQTKDIEAKEKLDIQCINLRDLNKLE